LLCLRNSLSWRKRRRGGGREGRNSLRGGKEQKKLEGWELGWGGGGGRGVT
jgi:hypothetical protein